MQQNENTVRLFIAVDLPAIVITEIERIQKELCEQNLFTGRYVRPEQVHVTMKFIGKIKECQISSIDSVLKKISFFTCKAQLCGVDVFSVGNKIKIIYLNLIVPELVLLAFKIDQVLRPWCESEKRDFVSHATIVRVKRVENKERLLEFLRKFKVEPIQFTIDVFALKQSVLTSDGPEYTTIKTYTLQ